MSSINWRQQEQKLVQSLPEFYTAQLGHSPAQVSCEIANRRIVITVEGAMTQLEKLLHANHQTLLVQNLRASLDEVLRNKLNAWLAELLQTEIIDLFIDTDITQDRMMAIAILPDTQNP
jgi:uncharacterized protein YbcI